MTGMTQRKRVIAGCALLAICASGWVAFRPSGPQVALAGEVVMADVATGELFTFRVGGRRGVMVPATNPRTGTATLLPVSQEAGVWRLGERELRGLSRIAADPAAVINRDTGEIRVAGARPKRVG
jgi:hypothetical protein